MNQRALIAFLTSCAGFLLPVCAMPAATGVAVSAALSQPALSPDGREIAFVSGGDIWSVPATGGEAQLLVSGAATESRPLYSPDGKALAFVSTRTGNGDIYVLDFASGQLRRITWDDGLDELSAWSHDARWLYFSSARDNVGGMDGVYRVRVSGGTPMPVSLEAYRNETGAAPAPHGSEIALVGEGMAGFQWWRHGHSHIDESAIWLLQDDATHRYTRLTPDDARAQWPMWAADGKSLYYMSDRSGTENIWQVQHDGGLSQRTHFASGRVLWPTISGDGRLIAFERGFGIWTLDTVSGKSRALPIHLHGAAQAAAITHENFSKGFTQLALSPDGKKAAFIVHGEVFATDSDKGGAAMRVTHTPAMEYELSWAPDSRRIVYVSERDNAEHLYLFDFTTGKETRLTAGPGEDTQPVFSPDGKQLAFLRDAKTLSVLELASHHVRELVKADIDLHPPLDSERPFAWSPDGRWIAYLAFGPRLYRNAYVVAVADGKGGAVSFLANTNADDLRWTPDGKALLFVTGQRTEPGQVARVDLIPRTPVFREDQFHDLFREPAPGEPSEHGTQSAKQADRREPDHNGDKHKIEPVRVVFDGIRERLSLIPTGLDIGSLDISTDGKSLLLTAQVAGRNNLYSYSIDPLVQKPPVAKQLTSTEGDKRNAQFTGDGKRAFYLDDGRIFSIAVADGRSKPLATSAEMDVDFGHEKQVMFGEAWHWLRDNFHDPHMHGVDWDAVRKEYAPRIAAASTPDAVRRLLNLMVGELDASHSGVRGGARPALTTGRLGLRFQSAAYEQHGHFRIGEVVPLSPAAIAGIHAGEYLLAVNDVRLDANSNLAQLLENSVGHETRIEVADTPDGKPRSFKLKPVTARAEAQLAYRAWVEGNRDYVHRISGGRLGYVHMPDMSLHSLRQLYLDLDAENATRDGVVIDVRNNFGGFVNAYALDVLARRPYLSMTFRGMQDSVTARSVLGQRALERPTVLITNRITLSDGEDFTEGYRTLGLGKVVGEPTAGWIIYTSNVPLIDGSSVRLPFITVTDAHGRPMELHPRPVDVTVDRPLGEAYAGKDSDLDAAVKTLLQQLGGRLSGRH
ncbi:MAG TPA: S41 family peptidase [Gammaproteobacteria bacterium]|nr:S41 family peptidase [Gammaproteobacteria bacterium]